MKALHRISETWRRWRAARTGADTEAFIGMLRQAAALLSAGRAVHTVWQELASLHEPCDRDPLTATNTATTTATSCCLHHVLRAQTAAVLRGTALFEGVTGPGTPEHWGQLAGSLRLCAATGMPVALVLSRLADAVDAGEDAHQAREAAAAGPRSTAQLLGWLPAAGLGMSAMLGTTVFDLLAHPAGWALLGVGIGLAVAGRRWTTSMIRSTQEAC